MLLLTIKKNLSLILPKNHSFVYFFASAASKSLNPFPKSNPIAEYLVNSCGFSSKKAETISRSISKSTSIDRACSFKNFFKHHGFTDTSIRRVITNYPTILSADAIETLQPNLDALRAMGFTDHELQLHIPFNPALIINPSAIPRLEFWRKFLGTKHRKDLVLVIKRNRGLINQDIVKGIAPKISLLKEHGLSEAAIIGIVKRGHGFICRSSKSIETLVNRAKEFLFDPKSMMFGHGLSSLSSIGRDTFEKKMEFYEVFGWSKEEFLAAFKKAPCFIYLSEENVMEKMEFLVGRAGCERSYIVSNPWLLMFSLEKRLRPRHYVMEVLKSNNIVGIGALYSKMCLPEKKFVERVVLPFKEQVPKIHEIYIAACAGQVPI